MHNESRKHKSYWGGAGAGGAITIVRDKYSNRFYIIDADGFKAIN